mmetsp:Transcript_918/g.1362  ORF Transcript_918/g.1362 Transcript_918/m.1362 type:complete len:185 (+) Transcript_918:717-1271(+)
MEGKEFKLALKNQKISYKKANQLINQLKNKSITQAISILSQITNEKINISYRISNTSKRSCINKIPKKSNSSYPKKAAKILLLMLNILTNSIRLSNKQTEDIDCLEISRLYYIKEIKLTRLGKHYRKIFRAFGRVNYIKNQKCSILIRVKAFEDRISNIDAYRNIQDHIKPFWFISSKFPFFWP